jgi:calnexin
MKLSSISISAALALLASASDSTDSEEAIFQPFDQSQLSSDSFFEQFDSDDWSQLWKISKSKRDQEFTYNGKWSVEVSSVNQGFINDKGLVLKTAAAHHAIHAQLPTPFINTDETLVLQYEVKLQEGLQCGGAYVKLLSSEGLPDDSSEFNNDTPYQIMFGPDKCGTTNKVHFIIRRKNPNSGKYEEKHLAVPPTSRNVKTTSLYTLIIKPNQDFEIRINGDVIKSGNLLDAGVLKPGLNPPKEVPDFDDTKPEDWDDRDVIPDPEQTEKPEDWDEDAPYLIPDPAQTAKPSSWDEEASEYIPDPESEKPEDWDDEEDGEWVAPLIVNPECETHGCGKWEPELVPNPDYKGKWKQPFVKNPDYKGEWAPRNIPNPDYYEDGRPSDLEAIGGIGFELWSMQNDILFDNIYLGHSIAEAELIGNSTFLPKIELEQKSALASIKEEDTEPKGTEAGSINDLQTHHDLLDEWIDHGKAFFENGQLYVEEFFKEPLRTLSERPVEGGLYATILVTFTTLGLTLFSFILSLLTGGSSAKVAVTRENTKEDISKIKVRSTASGAQKKESSAHKVSESKKL